MKTFIAETIHHEPDGDYWVQFKPGGRWVPCTIKTELLGIESRVSVRSGWFSEMALWPEDPEMNDEFSNALFLGPISQPEPP